MFLLIELSRRLKNLRRTVLLILAGALLAGAMALYINGYREADSALRQLSQNEPIAVYIVSRDGRSREDINIDAAHFDALSDAGVHSRIYTADAVGAFSSEAKENGVFDTEILAASDLEISGAQCLVSETYASAYNLTPGEEITLPISLVTHTAAGREYTLLGTETLKIADTYPGDGPDLLLPADWLRSTADHSGVPFFYSSFSAVLDDPMALDAFKENLPRLTFREPSAGLGDSFTGDGVRVEDAMFRTASGELTEQLAGYKMARTPALWLLVGIAVVAAYFALLPDRREMAVAYLLGRSKWGIGKTYLCVALVSEGIGCVLGLILLGAVDKISLLSALMAAGIFIPGGFIGAAAALAVLLRFAPLQVLAPQKPEKIFTPEEEEAAA